MTASQIIKLCDFPLEWVLYFSRPIFEIVESHFCCFYMGAHQIKPSEKINVLMIYLLKMGTCDPSACDELDMKKNDVDLQLYNLNRIRYSFQSVISYILVFQISMCEEIFSIKGLICKFSTCISYFTVQIYNDLY